MNGPRIVIVARKLDRGGAERQLVSLAAGLRRRGRDVHVVLLYGSGALDRELLEAGVPLQAVGKRGRWDLLGFAVRFIALVRALRPDLVYSFLDLPNLLASITRRLVGRPKVVWSIRAAYMDMRPYDWLTRLVPRVEACFSNLPSLVIANSHAGAEWAIKRGFPPERIRVVENGVDTARFHPIPQARIKIRQTWGISNDDTVIGLVGRLDPMKDHATFLRACSLLAQAIPNARFACVGGGSATYQAELKELAETLGIADRVTWAGIRQDIPEMFNAMDIACSASSFGEGFPNVVGEAMACGVPCAVTDVGDSARIVGSLGEVVPVRNHVALAAGVTRLLDRIAREPSLKTAVRRRVEESYSLERMIARTEQLVLGLI